MAENLIQKTYVKKKADRLIKEQFRTEDSDEDDAQIEEVKSAVKQIQLEVAQSVQDENHRQASEEVEVSDEAKPKIDMGQNQPVELLT